MSEVEYVVTRDGRTIPVVEWTAERKAAAQVDITELHVGAITGVTGEVDAMSNDGEMRRFVALKIEGELLPGLDPVHVTLLFPDDGLVAYIRNTLGTPL